MLCESSLRTNNTRNYIDPWIKPIKKINSGASSTSVNSQRTSFPNNNSSGTVFVPELSFKTSGSPEAKSITPDKNNDVTMDEANEGGAAAVAAAADKSSENGSDSAAVAVAVAKGGDDADAPKNGGEAAGSSDGENTDGDKDVDMGEANADAAAGEKEKPGASPLDKLVEAVEMKTEAMDETSDAGGDSATEVISNKSGEKKSAPTSADEKAESSGGEEEKNNNGSEGKKSDDATNNQAEAAEGDDKKEEAAPPVEENLPLLIGTLAYSDRDNLRRHIIRGNWKYENSHAVRPQRFELIRTIPPEENLEELPKDGEFHGSFNVQLSVKTSKGKIKMKNRAVPESGVKLTFKKNKDEDSEGEGGGFTVNGTGTNEYGVFELFGTATKNTEVEGVSTYSVSVRKKYVALPPGVPAVAAGGGEKKDKKRKHADASGEDEEEKPPPTELPSEGICLRGKLVRNTSDELSLDNAAVHRITGLWAMKQSIIIDEPDTCEKFEYEHKCSGDSTVFPLSGRYTGFFYVYEHGVRTKVAERDVTLKFRPNNAGYHNVDGRGSNIFGKYNITGTLTKEGIITLFRHFQAPKVKASKKSTQVKITAPTNGISGSSSKLSPKAGGAVAALPPSSSLLTFDDVNTPNEADGPVLPLTPPEQFTATSRGILKIEADGTHTCSGSWAMTNEHFQNGITSKYHFGLQAHNAVEGAKVMLEQKKASGEDKDDDRQIKDMPNDEVSPVTLANSTFPIDSTQYKGSFKLRKGATRTQTIVDNQIVLKYVKNTGGSFNVYGKGSNEMGTFDLVGTLILQGKSNGLMQLYRMYPPAAEPLPVAQPASRKSSKVFPGSLTEKASANSGPMPAMKPPERFIPSTSGLLRRESSRMSRLPSRLEEDDPQAQMDRLMERCRQILAELQEADIQRIFAAPVDPIALGIPTYPDVIKEPMDLGTIQTKMDHNEIESPEEFSRLVRLTFQNAVTFNTLPDNIVHVTARNLLGKFIKKFGTIDKAFNAAKKNKKLTKAERNEIKRKEKEAAKDVKRKAKEEKERKRKAEVEASNESKRMKLENVLAANRSTMAAISQAAPKDPDADVTRDEYNLLLQAIKQVQEQIVGLHKLVKKSSKSSAPAPSSAESKVNSDVSFAFEPSYAAESQSTSQPSKPKKKKPKKEPEPEPSPPPSPKSFPSHAPVVEDLQPLSFEEQEALSEAINLLPERLLPGAMQIIREADFVNDDDDEIDLDIDQLDTKTQRKLQSFVMENVKTKKKKKQSKKQAKAAAAAPQVSAAPPTPPPEEKKPSASSRLPGGKSFFALGDDDDSDDDNDEEEEEDLKADFATNWVANPTSQDAAKEEKEAGNDSDKDDEEDLWGAARKEAEASKAREADRAKREEKMIAEAELAAQKRMAEAAALGEQARAKREEEEAAEARLREEQEREADEAKKAAREKALQEVNSVEKTVDLGDAQRSLMEQYEQEFNDNYSAGASPSSDFGF